MKSYSGLTDSKSVSWIDVAPPLVMVIGSVVSVLWLSVGLPSLIGDLTYPLLLSCAFVLAGAIFSWRNKRGWFLLPWGACVLATLYQIIAKSFPPAINEPELTQDVVNLAASAGVFIALVIGVAIGRFDARRSSLFVGLYFAWAVTDGPNISAASTAITMVMTTIAVVESIILAWAIYAYGRRSLDQALVAVLGLLAVHHLLVGWYSPIGVEGEFTWAQHFIDSLVQGPVFVIFINAILIVFILLLRKLTRAASVETEKGTDERF